MYKDRLIELLIIYGSVFLTIIIGLGIVYLLGRMDDRIGWSKPMSNGTKLVIIGVTALASFYVHKESEYYVNKHIKKGKEIGHFTFQAEDRTLKLTYIQVERSPVATGNTLKGIPHRERYRRPAYRIELRDLNDELITRQYFEYYDSLKYFIGKNEKHLWFITHQGFEIYDPFSFGLVATHQEVLAKNPFLNNIDLRYELFPENEYWKFSDPMIYFPYLEAQGIFYVQEDDQVVIKDKERNTFKLVFSN